MTVRDREAPGFPTSPTLQTRVVIISDDHPEIITHEDRREIQKTTYGNRREVPKISYGNQRGLWKIRISPADHRDI